MMTTPAPHRCPGGSRRRLSGALLAMATATVLAVSALGTGPLGPSSAQASTGDLPAWDTYLPGGQFSNPPSRLSLTNAGAVSISKVVGRNGFGMRMKPKRTANIAVTTEKVTDPNTAPAGTEYTAALWIKSDDKSIPVVLLLEEWHGGEVVAVTQRTVSTWRSWRQVRTTTTSTRPGSKWRVTFRVKQQDGTSVDVDDLRLFRAAIAGDPPPPPTAERDPLLWPYPANSIWNHPRGNAATLVPAGISAPTTLKTLVEEEELLIIDPDAPLVPLRKHNAGWTGANRCAETSDTGTLLHPGLPIPAGWSTTGFHGSTPNHSAAVVQSDYTLFETQPLHACDDGRVVSQYAAPLWQGDSLLTGQVPSGSSGAVGGGSHGGSYMTAFGGTIRLGEWVPGGKIPHATKIELDGSLFYSPLSGGYRWPALRADSYYDDPSNPDRYAGTVPALRQGSLLTLPPGFVVNSLQSQPARILAQSMKDYGTYVVDDTKRNVVALATEWGPQGRVLDEFDAVWGFPMAGKSWQPSNTAHGVFLTDMETIYENLAVVDDNTPTSIGGAGNRMAPWAPPLQTP